MKPYRIAIAGITLALLAACASTPRASQEATGSSNVVEPAAAGSVAAAPATSDVAAASSVAAPDAGSVVAAPASAATASADTVQSASAGSGNDAVGDFDAIYGTAGTDGKPSTGIRDPWEKYNRHMHAFNNGVDKYVAHPVAKAYVKVLPQAVRNRVSDFFDNLGSPVTMINQLLQGHPSDAWNTLGRFLMNTTIGLGGLFDPATRAGIAHKHDDFGQTLAVWGWRNSRYFELPFLGPRTLRDTFGMVGDIPLSPTHYIQNSDVRYGLYAVQLVDTRAQLLSMDSMREGAADDYALVRDAWMQHRNYQIRQDLHKKNGTQDDSTLPDYLRDTPAGDEKDVPANVIPLPATAMPTIR